MKTNTCIYTGEIFENATHEHILQASLGARWECNTLICDRMQKHFSGDIDGAVAAAALELRTLFGTKNGRGQEPPTLKSIKSQDGSTYHVKPGMQPVMAEPTYTLTDLGEGKVAVSFNLANAGQLEWAKAKLRKEHPDLQFDDETLGPGIPSQVYLGQPLHFQLELGGKDFFRGILKSAFNLLGVNFPDLALQSGFQPLKEYIVDGAGDSAPFIRWVISHDPLDLPRLGEIDHLLGLWCRNGSVFGILQLFGDIPFLLKLGDGIECDDFDRGYLVNPLRDSSPAEDRSPSFDVSNFPTFEEGPILPNAELWAAMTTRMSRILGRLKRRGMEERVEQIVNEVFLPHLGAPPTAEMFDELRDRLHVLFENMLPKSS